MHKYKSTLHACYTGYITQAIVNNLAPVLFVIFRNEFGISFEMIGRLTLINFGTQIAADYLTLKFADRFGYRKAVVAAHAFCASGLVGLGLFPALFPSPYIGLMAAVMVYAVGGGIIEVLISPIVDSLPGDEKASAMSLLHSFYCWGQLGVILITTVLVKLLGDGVWFIIPVLWSVIPIYNMFKFTKVPLMQGIPEHEKTPFRQLLSSGLFLIALILMLCAGASELTMAQWSSLFAEKGLQVPKLLGDLLGPCLFAAFMGTGRLVYGIWGHRLQLRRALMISGAFCLLCYAAAIFAGSPVAALLGCALCGLSVSLMWPGTFSYAAARFPKGGTAMFGALAIFGDLGGSTGPWLAGFVSDLAQKSDSFTWFGIINAAGSEQLGLKAGLSAAMLFPLILLICTALLKDRSVKELQL